MTQVQESSCAGLNKVSTHRDTQTEAVWAQKLSHCLEEGRKAKNCLRGSSESITEQAPEPRSSLPPRQEFSQTRNFQPCCGPAVTISTQHRSPHPHLPHPLTRALAHRTRPQRSGKGWGWGPISPYRAAVQWRLSRARTTFPTRQLNSCVAKVIRRSRMDNLHQFCAGVSQILRLLQVWYSAEDELEGRSLSYKSRPQRGKDAVFRALAATCGSLLCCWPCCC